LRTIATGVLEAARQADITFRQGGEVTVLPIREGQTLRQGALLAEVDDTELQMKLTQTRLALDEAIVNKKDLLIANGGDAEVDSSVSAQKLELILTLSGYNKALHNIRQT
jgi:multidrug efflux pump subunit AcrA (membrane-fusion protein)